MDVGKQLFSGAAAHVSGLIISIIAANGANGASPCGWYFVVFTIDSTLGMVVSILVHKAIVRHAQARAREQKAMV